MIDKQPLDVFGGDSPEETQPPAAAMSRSESDRGVEAGFWLCQSCAAKIPFGETACPECSRSPGNQRPKQDPESEVLRFFTERSTMETLGVLHDLSGIAGQRETYQEYFRESLRRQANESALPPLPAEESPLICRWCNTPHDDGQAFCSHCGTRLPPRIVPNAPAASAQCEWCQASIESGTTACPACGGTIAAPDRTISGLTDLTSVEKAAEYAFQQGVPLHSLQIGLGGEISRMNRFWNSLFGKPK